MPESNCHSLSGPIRFRLGLPILESWVVKLSSLEEHGDSGQSGVCFLELHKLHLLGLPKVTQPSFIFRLHLITVPLAFQSLVLAPVVPEETCCSSPALCLDESKHTISKLSVHYFSPSVSSSRVQTNADEQNRKRKSVRVPGIFQSPMGVWEFKDGNLDSHSSSLSL